MPRCILCDEWAGPHTDLHESCLLELCRQVQRQSRLARWLSQTLRTARAVFAAISGSAVRAL